jgi:hypothetical protein
MAKPPTFTSTEDRHFVFNAAHHELKCFRTNGQLEWHIRAHGEGGGGDSSLPNGNTPPGLYLVNEVVPTVDKRFGFYKITLSPIELDKGLGRSNIEIHGGGSGQPKPFASQQGWEKTHGCIRVQNHDLGLVVHKVRLVHGHRAQVWLTVKWW